MTLLLALVACDPAPPATPAVTPAPVAAPAPPPAATALVAEATTQTRTSPNLAPKSQDGLATLAYLGQVCDTYAADPEDPWGIAHALLARGQDLVLPNDEPALDYLYATYAQIGEVQGRELPYFPATSPTGVSIEPHTDLVLKAVIESGASPDRVVLVDGREFTLAEHWEHSLRTTFVNGKGESSFKDPNDMPWGVQALATWAPKGLQWTAYEGTPMSMDDLVKLQVHVLTGESTFMMESMLAGVPFQKKRQGIFAHTCGGAHALQGSTLAMAMGHAGPQDAEKLALQGPLMTYRYQVEMAIYEQGRKQVPEMSLVLWAQQLKFVGHYLESMHKLSATGAYEPNAQDQQVMLQAVNDLITTTVELKKTGALDNLPQVKEKDLQLYKDLVGDSCHAVRGLELAYGDGSVQF
jgi:hypothetical protein